MLAEWPFDEIQSLPGYPQLGNALRAILIQEVIDGKRQLTWPKPVAPWTAVEYWQWTSRYPPEKIPGYFMGPGHKLAVDMNFAKLSRADYEIGHPIPGLPPVPEPPPSISHVLEIYTKTGQVESVPFKAALPWTGDDLDYVAVDSRHFVEPIAPPPAPAPEPAPQPGPGVVNDVKYGILRYQRIENPLTLSGRFTPAVVQLQDHPAPNSGKGMVIPVLPSAWDYMRKLNNDKGYAYCRSVGDMWINSPYTGDDAKAESISVQCNFVSWTEVVNHCMKLRCFPNNQDFSIFDPAKVNWESRPDLFFKAIATVLDGSQWINPGTNIDCYIPLMARRTNNGTGELWLAENEIEPFPELPVRVIILPKGTGHLTVRKSFGVESEVIGSYSTSEVVTLLEYHPIGASVWARTRDGWICLLLAEMPGQHRFLTSWTLETPGVIPPATWPPA